MPDLNLRQAVLDELRWDPSINAAHIGVTARNVAVALTGYVDSYAEKLGAEQSTERVAGVGEELEVRYSSSPVEGDEDIAKRVVQVLAWDVGVPDHRLIVRVEKGWAKLSLSRPLALPKK